jgi:exodeoxyribonuclease V alpha subunit
MQLTDHQQSELHNATLGTIGLLTGGPGSGKTTCLAHLVRDLQQRNGHGGMAAAAPTGKAARRMTENLAERGVRLTATTIHRLLGYSYADGAGFFSYCRSNPLPHQFVFIDEASMIDSSLMASLLAARRKGTHILFIGDPNQLPPVGHGAPLRDMIAMGLPGGHLREIHRTAGRIVKCCKSIAGQGKWEASREIDLENGENLYVDREWRTPEEQIQSLRDWLDSSSAAWDGFERTVDPIWDSQVIVPLNEKSEVSRKKLNPILQGFLNPSGKQAKGNPYRQGDKIVCGKNGWYLAAPGCPEEELNDERRVYCANGEQARVIEVEERHTICELDTPTRLVRVSKPRKSENDDDTGKWELAYAISCHKSQGAEWPAIFLIGDEASGAKWLCDRHWVLTGISRAKQLCVCIAKPQTLAGWCRKSHLWQRRTMAVEKMKELENGSLRNEICT